MVVMVMLVIFIIVVVALGVEVCITSWSISRASSYKRQKLIAEEQSNSLKQQVESITNKFRCLDEYATKISWLLAFLNNRYGKFADIDTELEKGIQPDDGSTAVSEMNQKYQDLKRAVKILKTTIRVYDKIDGIMTSIASQVSSIAEDLNNDEDEKVSEEAKGSGKEEVSSEMDSSAEKAS